MLDSLVLALSIAVASSHTEARDVTAPEPIAFTQGPGTVRRSVAENMIGMLNSVRNAAGLDPLTEDPELSLIALEHAQEMVQKQYFGHQAPDGPSIKQRLEAHHIRKRLDGENLAWCTTFHEAAIDLWQSPSHQTNERDPRFHHVGVAAVQTGSFGTLYVQIFTD